MSYLEAKRWKKSWNMFRNGVEIVSSLANCKISSWERWRGRIWNMTDQNSRGNPLPRHEGDATNSTKEAEQEPQGLDWCATVLRRKVFVVSLRRHRVARSVAGGGFDEGRSCWRCSRTDASRSGASLDFSWSDLSQCYWSCWCLFSFVLSVILIYFIFTIRASTRTICDISTKGNCFRNYLQ